MTNMQLHFMIYFNIQITFVKLPKLPKSCSNNAEGSSKGKFTNFAYAMRKYKIIFQQVFLNAKCQPKHTVISFFFIQHIVHFFNQCVAS